MLSSQIRREHGANYLFPQIRLHSHWDIYGSLCDTSFRSGTFIFIQLEAGVIIIAETFLLRPSFNSCAWRQHLYFTTLLFTNHFLESSRLFGSQILPLICNSRCLLNFQNQWICTVLLPATVKVCWVASIKSHHANRNTSGNKSIHNPRPRTSSRGRDFSNTFDRRCWEGWDKVVWVQTGVWREGQLGSGVPRYLTASGQTSNDL